MSTAFISCIESLYSSLSFLQAQTVKYNTPMYYMNERSPMDNQQEHNGQ